MSIFWRYRTALQWACLALCSCAPGAALGEPEPQPLEAIVATAITAGEERAGQFGFDNVSVEVRSLDQRLRLPRCEAPLSGTIPRSSSVPGLVNVRVDCATPKPWSIYVRARIVAQRSVPVLTRPLPRGARIQDEDLQLVDMPVDSVLDGIIFEPQQIVGMELARGLNAGSTLKVSQLRRPKVIKRGQLVTLKAGEGGLEVQIQGKALADAVEGERVMVSNLSSGKTVEGTANSDGTVTVR
ncbi:MAG: flagella basal body P-ring formation protein FlgA [Halioglobus sp.]|nr:flagella basal body P-ring formation protein FlgA [Halioglobus sp.]|tara:strand:+ start:1348 stop:2070 length:723 start_codon:yes stop_codon:yes gene_type:complete